MTIWYTARNTFGPDFEDGTSWTKYKQSNKLDHLIELVSLDSILGEPSFEPDFDNPATYEVGVTTDNLIFTYCYRDLDYVLKNISTLSGYNLLAVSLNPDVDCRKVPLQNFEFLGYDLVDQDHDNSAISNCGGFDETFLPSELNKVGLIDSYEKAYDIRIRLLANNPQEHHADTNVWAIWRHKHFVRK